MHRAVHRIQLPPAVMLQQCVAVHTHTCMVWFQHKHLIFQSQDGNFADMTDNHMVVSKYVALCVCIP